MHSTDEPVLAQRPFAASHTRALQAIRSVRVSGRTLAYALPALFAFVAAQTWFVPGTVIAGGDLPPPIAPGSDYLSHWNQFVDGTGGASYDIVALPYYEGLRLASWLGLDAEIFQRVWLSGLFAASAAAIVFFAFALVRTPVAAGVAGMLSAFNAYRLVTPADHVPLVTTIVAGLLGGLVLRAGLRPGRSRATVFALVSMGLGFVFVNPPHAVLVAAWLALTVLMVAVAGGVPALKRLGRFASAAIPLAVVVNLWWVVPALLVLGGPGFRERFAAAGIEAWAWTHRRASIPNALALNTSWAWPYPEYFPYAHRLTRAPLSYLRYVPAALAGAGFALVWRRERRVALALAALAVPVLVVAKGLNEPLGGLNHWLYAHLPGFWLFRDPAKVVLLLSLIFALLAGVAVARLVEPSQIVHPWLGRSVAALAIAGALAYVHPLFTGAVIAGKRPSLPPMHVHMAPAWAAAGAFLNGQSGDGRVLVLPRTDYYQQPTRWGYYGVSFSRFVIHRGVIESDTSYLRSEPTVSEIAAAIEQDLLQGRLTAASRELRALGVRWVLLRRDLDANFPGRTIRSAAALGRALSHVPALRHVRSFGLLDLFGVDRATEVSARVPVWYLGAPNALVPALAALPEGAGLVPAAAHGDRLWLSRLGPAHFLRLERVPAWRVRAVSADGYASVVFDDPNRWSVGTETLVPPPALRLGARRVRPPFLVTVGDRLYRVSQGSGRLASLGLLRLHGVTRVRIWRLMRTQSLEPRLAGSAGDCRRYGLGLPPGAGRPAVTVSRAPAPVLRLAARTGSACVALPVAVARFGPTSRLRLALSYRRMSGNPPRVCLWQDAIDRCAPFPALARTWGWQQLDTIAALPASVSGLRLYLYADGSRRARSVVEYRQIRIDQYAVAAEGSLPDRTLAPVTPVALPAGTLSLGVAQSLDARAADMRSASAVGDCNSYDDRTLAQVGISAAVVGPPGRRAVRLAAFAHSACVYFPIPLRDVQAPYRVTLDYRRVLGQSARVCLWQEGPNSCAPLPQLRADPGWHRLDAVVPLDASTSRLRLFLYADGGGATRTVSEYRGVRVEPSTPAALLAIPRPTPRPVVRGERLAPGRFRARVDGARGPFLLVLAETYAPGWSLERAGGNTREAPHLKVDGYANGWLVPWKGTYELTMVYRPERYARAARRISAVGALGLLGLLAWRRAQPRWRRLRTRRAASR